MIVFVWQKKEYKHVLYRNIDQKLVNSLHGLLNCEIGGLDCRAITTEYRTRWTCNTYVAMRWSM